MSGGRASISVTVLAVGVTLAVGGGTTASAPRAVPAPAGLDHFKCYVTTPPTSHQHTVALKDQFGDWKAKVVALQTLCNPVSKNQGKVLHKIAHLACYKTSDTGATFKPRKVIVVNQFGKREIKVLRPASLCVPSLKSKGTIAPPTTPDSEKLVDHFRCYSVDPLPAPKTVKLADQFTTKASKVARLVRLCNPVGKNGGIVRRPKAHLVCYSITDAGQFEPVGVRLRNQFGLTGSLKAVTPQMLCLPSSKTKIG
jgi:hypothetical protein